LWASHKSSPFLFQVYAWQAPPVWWLLLLTFLACRLFGSSSGTMARRGLCWKADVTVTVAVTVPQVLPGRLPPGRRVHTVGRGVVCRGAARGRAPRGVLAHAHCVGRAAAPRRGLPHARPRPRVRVPHPHTSVDAAARAAAAAPARARARRQVCCVPPACRLPATCPPPSCHLPATCPPPACHLPATFRPPSTHRPASTQVWRAPSSYPCATPRAWSHSPHTPGVKV
jgi:hypothetical protein